MSVFQFRKTPLHRQGDPVENTGNFTCDPRQHESTECGFHHFSGVSGILQFLCVGLRTLTLLDKNPQAKVVFVDESPMAVASSRLNVETNMPEALDRCEFMINNALSGVEPFRFNAVLCNPPFHQQHALTDNVAWEMFHHARRCLKINGELYIVANRHLDYFHKLKKIFGNCTTIATNNKFVVLKAVKLGRRR